MIIVTIRTDRPQAELGLYDNDRQLAYESWEAHRQLAETIHQKIATLLSLHDKGWQHIEAIVVFRGPGSFTGLRIGISLANALAYSLGVPIVAAGSDMWIEQGVRRLVAGETDTHAMPEYGSAAHVTLPKK